MERARHKLQLGDSAKTRRQTLDIAAIESLTRLDEVQEMLAQFAPLDDLLRTIWGLEL